MCRLVAYLGPPIRLDQLVLEGDHALVVQSYSPKEMRGALLNADGFGVAWYAEPDAPEPALYRTAMPMWGDDNLPRIARHVRAPAFLANARSATPGMPVSLANVSPFVAGRLAFTHNGYVERFHEAVARPLRDGLSDRAWRAVAGQTDSEHLFGLFLDRAAEEGAPGAAEALARALARTVHEAAALARARGVRALLNVAATDGAHLVAMRAAEGDEAPSLYALRGGPGTPYPEGATVLASEPLVAGLRWEALPPGALLVASAGRVEVRRAAAPPPAEALAP